MEAVLLVIHLIVALAIIAIVLIQPSEAGGFLGSSGSMSNMMMPRRSADVLTRATTILAGCFFVTSLLLAVMASNRPAHKSILDAATDVTGPVVEGKKNEPTPTLVPGAPAKPEAVKPAPPAKKGAPEAPISK
jgi:preprotein translocase subunit SecG